MIKKNKITKNDGFTLIEAIMAVAVFSIGILSIYLVQTTAVRGNATASGITTASNWASDQIEQLLALGYNDPLLADDDDNGTGGLGETVDTGGTVIADGSATSTDSRYTIYWNVADNQPIPNIKQITVLVTMVERGVLKTISFNHCKAQF